VAGLSGLRALVARFGLIVTMRAASPDCQMLINSPKFQNDQLSRFKMSDGVSILSPALSVV
jgi:hypothetical protein